MFPQNNEIIGFEPIFFVLFDEVIQYDLILPYVQIMVRLVAGKKGGKREVIV